MQTAIHNLQKNLVVILLYVSGFSGFLSDMAGATSKTALYVLFDVLMIMLALTSLSSFRTKLSYFVILIIACIVINMSYSPATLYASFNGMREIISILAIVLFFTKIFAEGNEEMAEEYIMIFKRYGFIFLVAQIPIAFIQFLQYGPSDAVGGTFGFGGSGVLTLIVVCLVYFLLHTTRNITVSVLLYITLIPLFLNETKISFILIPMMILLLKFRPKLKNILLAGGGALLFLILFNQFYSASYLDFDNSASGIFSADFLSDYLMADIYTYDDVPRFTKIILAWKLLSEQLNTFLFGFEYGLFKGGNVVELSQFGQSYQWLLSGTRPYLFFLLVQGGLLLVTGMVWLVVHINRYFKNSNNFKIFLFIVFLLMLCYNDAFRNQNFATVYFFLVFYANSKLYKDA